MSNTLPESSSHYAAMIKRVTIDIGKDEEIKDSENFQDIRMEMNSVGLNLTSVLINPRETIFEDIFDEFSAEQSAPLEHQSPFSDTNGKSNPALISSSIHASNVKKNSSHHASAHSTPMNGSNSGSSIYAAGTNLFTMTVNEAEQLDRFIIRMAKVFATYYYTHGSSSSASVSSPKTRHTKKQGLDDLRNCYGTVPSIFFQPDFSLLSQDTFRQIFETIHVDEIIEKIRAKHIQMNTKTVEDHLQMSTSSMTTPKKGISPRAYSKTTEKDSTPDYSIQCLQDSLSQYLDLVEMALLRQIYTRSPAFFRSLDDIRSLQFTVSDTTQHLITNVRGKLSTSDENLSSQALLIPKMARRQANVATLGDKLGFMQQVIRARAEILLQLEAEDYISALELISLAKNIYYGCGLDAIHAMKAIGSQLNDYDNLVCEIMCNKFVSLAIQWEEDTVSAAAAAASLNTAGAVGGTLSGRDSVEYDEFNLGGSSSGASGTSNSSLLNAEKSLRQLLNSLVITERVQSALNMYKHRLLEAIRLIVRTCVLEYLANFDLRSALGEAEFDDPTGAGDGGSDTPFQQRVKEMSHENFLACLNMCYEHIILSLTKANVFHSFIERELSEDSMSVGILSTGTSPTPSEGSIPSETTISAQKTLKANMIVVSKQCLSAACDLAQKSIARLITLRKDSNAKLSPASMKVLWQMSLRFVLQLEDIFVSTAYSLRQTLLAQTTLFLKYIHETFKGRLVNTLDSERFTQCDVSPERQDEINKLVSGKSFIAATITPNASLLHVGAATDANDASKTASNVGAFKASLKDKQMKPVIIDGTEYRVIWSALLLVEFILTYLEIAFHFSPATDTVIKCIVDLLELFDTRTNQLVLGAEAIQSAARLRSISAKHLAITAQSISLIVTLIPHIRAALLAQLPVKQQMQVVSLETWSQKYNDHHNKIVSKFVSIVSDFVDQSATGLRAYNWDIAGNDECQYFVDMKKNVTALHTVLLSVLPVSQIQEVFSRIFALLNRKIVQHFEEIMPLESAGKDRITDAISDLIVTFTRLRHLDAKALTLEETFNKRYRGLQ